MGSQQRRIYRVTSVHEYPSAYGLKPKEGTYTRVRHFLSKSAATRNFNCLKETQEKWDAQKTSSAQIFTLQYTHWGKPVEVRLDESEPVMFMVDEIEFQES